LPNTAESLVAAGCGNNEVNLTISGYFLNFAASSEPLVASPAVYEWAPTPASLPLSTTRYSVRIGFFAKYASRISRVPAA